MISVRSDPSSFKVKMKTKNMAKERSLKIENVTSPRHISKTYVKKQENFETFAKWGFFLYEVENYRREIRFELFSENDETKQQAKMTIKHLMQTKENHEN